MDGKSVRLRVYIGRSQPKFFIAWRIGEIDVVRTPEDAATKWSQIEWREDGLHVGVDGNRTRLFVPLEDIKPVLNESASGIYAGLRATRSHAHQTLPPC